MPPAPYHDTHAYNIERVWLVRKYFYNKAARATQTNDDREIVPEKFHVSGMDDYSSLQKNK